MNLCRQLKSLGEFFIFGGIQVVQAIQKSGCIATEV